MGRIIESVVFMSYYYKKTDKNGQMTKLDYSPVAGIGEPISRTEYCMMKIAIKIFLNGEDIEKIKAEDWWK